MFMLLLVLSGCTFLFFNPGKELVSDPQTAAYAPEEVGFKSGDGTALTGWYFKARGRELGTILVCHGNVENMSTHVKLDLWLVDAGYNVFIFDYRGYGRSGGIPDVKGINLDAEAALETLLAQHEGQGHCVRQEPRRRGCGADRGKISRSGQGQGGHHRKRFFELSHDRPREDRGLDHRLALPVSAVVPRDRRLQSCRSYQPDFAHYRS